MKKYTHDEKIKAMRTPEYAREYRDRVELFLDNQKQREALLFYGDKNNYAGPIEGGYFTTIENGARARAVTEGGDDE